MLVARDGNDPSFFGRKPNVLPLDERANYWAPGRDRTDSIPGYKSGAPPFVRQEQIKLEEVLNSHLQLVGQCSKHLSYSNLFYTGD